MNANEIITGKSQVAEWHVVDGDIRRNTAAEKVCEYFCDARKAHKKVEASYVGAYLLHLLQTHQWLKTSTLSFKPSAANDDEGGSFRTVDCSFSDVTAMESQPFPSELADDDGAFDPESAEDFLQQEMQDNCMESEVYAGMTEVWDYDDITLLIERAKVAHLLESKESSGLEAFRLLVPQYLHLISAVPALVESTETVAA